jgi:hypothetical protein
MSAVIRDECSGAGREDLLFFFIEKSPVSMMKSPWPISNYVIFTGEQILKCKVIYLPWKSKKPAGFWGQTVKPDIDRIVVGNVDKNKGFYSLNSMCKYRILKFTYYGLLIEGKTWKEHRKF